MSKEYKSLFILLVVCFLGSNLIASSKNQNKNTPNVTKIESTTVPLIRDYKFPKEDIVPIKPSEQVQTQAPQVETQRVAPFFNSSPCPSGNCPTPSYRRW